jgi:aspartate aminotransferase
MMTQMPATTRRLAAIEATMAPIQGFLADSAWARRDPADPALSDFVFGNPHQAALPAFVEALQRWSTPRDSAWFAYKMSEAGPRATIVASLRQSHGLPFADEDIVLTNGAFAGLSVALQVVVEPGDEVIFVSPPWFFYEALIVAAGGVPVRVGVRPGDFDLDLAAIERAITPRTRAIIVNSPNNPTGAIYPAATLAGLADRLAGAARHHGRPIYLISDEAYRRIVFDGRAFISPAAHYPDTMIVYTYGKTLLTPGQRMGYIALPPALAAREAIRRAMQTMQIVTGWAFPNALLQHALPDLENLSIDVAAIQRRRDHLVAALREMGYLVHVPAGTFYLLPRSPLADDRAFADLLADEGVLVLPGSIAEMPGYFRVSLTATDEMVARALPGFARAMERAIAA